LANPSHKRQSDRCARQEKSPKGDQIISDVGHAIDTATKSG
jgi:hypothetical protein